MTVTVYSTGPSCQKCRLTKRHLERRGHDVVEAPITELDPAVVARFASAPVVQVGEDFWDDYRPDRIDALVA